MFKKYEIGYSRSYALCIGIRDYANEYSTLDTADTCAMRVGDAFRSQGYIVAELLNENAIDENVQEWLISMQKATQENDRLLIYFAGHGFQKGTEGYFALHPNSGSRTLMLMQSILDHIPHILAKHIIFVLDCCYSIRVVKTRGIREADPELIVVNSTRQRAVEIITATGDHEAYDRSPMEGQDDDLSPFTHFFLLGLRGAAATNDYDVITSQQLATYIKRQVEGHIVGQTPTYSTIYPYHQGGSYIFRFPKTEAAKLDDDVNSLLGGNDSEFLTQVDPLIPNDKTSVSTKISDGLTASAKDRIKFERAVGIIENLEDLVTFILYVQSGNPFLRLVHHDFTEISWYVTDSSISLGKKLDPVLWLSSSRYNLKRPPLFRDPIPLWLIFRNDDRLWHLGWAPQTPSERLSLPIFRIISEASPDTGITWFAEAFRK